MSVSNNQGMMKKTVCVCVMWVLCVQHAHWMLKGIIFGVFKGVI